MEINKNQKRAIAKSLKDKKYYNANEFNAFQALVAYAVLVVVFYIVGKYLPYLVRFIREKTTIKDYFLWQIILSIISQGIILLFAVVMYKLCAVTPFSADGFTQKINAVDTLMSVMLIFGVGICFTALHRDFSVDMVGIFGDLGLSISQETIQKSNQTFVFIYIFIIVPVLPAICEELFFRGVVMRGLKQWGWFSAVIVSSLLFALMHGSFGMIILQFLIGFAISAVVVICKNHLYGCIMHFATNFFIGVFLAIPEIMGEFFHRLNYVGSAFITIFGIAFLIISIYYFINKYLANYKSKLNGTYKKRQQENKTVCILQSDMSVLEKSYTDLDLNNHSQMEFLCGKRFCTLNKKSNFSLSITLGAMCFILAIASIFIDTL